MKIESHSSTAITGRTDAANVENKIVAFKSPHRPRRSFANAFDHLQTMGSRPRIAMISTHGYVAANPPLGAVDTGGQVVYVLELSKQLAQMGYEVDIWTRRFDLQAEVEHVAEHVRIIRIPCGGRGFIAKEYLHESLNTWIENALRFIQIHRLNYQFINSHYWDAGIAGGELAATLAIPHLHTPHSLGVWKKRQMERDFPGDADRFENIYQFGIRNREEARIYCEADRIIATTPIQMDMLHEDYGVPLEKIETVLPGYDEKRFFPVSTAKRDEIRQRLGFKGKVILALGRLARNKGYDLLIESFQAVLARVPDARLYLAIGGEKISKPETRILEECKALVKTLNLENYVTFTNWISDADLPDYYRAADAFALSSRYEPFGMTAIEAMACGTPVISTIHGGFWRVMQFGRTGLFADPMDPLDFGVTASKPLLYPHLWSELSIQGANKARDSFTWRGIATELLATLKLGNRAALIDDTTDAPLLGLQKTN